MYRKCAFFLCLILLLAVSAMAAEENGSNGPNGPDASGDANGSGDPEAKAVRGMAVLGNNEAPMSLFIVPWKSSELGVGANLSRSLNERDVPVDRDVFMRELDFYQVSAGSNTTAPAAVAHVVKAH